jgi:hypothetical protein
MEVIRMNRMKRIGVVLALALLLPSTLPAFGEAKKQTYQPNVTRADLVASGAKCSGNLCTDTTGRMWNCGGGGKCSVIKKTRDP